MKSDRIFLTNDPNTYSEKEYNGIKIEDIVAKLASVRDAKESEALPKEILAAIAGENEEGTPTRNLKVAEMPESFKQWTIENGKPVKKTEDKDGEAEVDADTEDEDEEGAKEVKASRTRKLHFNDPSQISAEALRTAEASGDKDLARTIRGLRDAVREKLSSKLDEQAQALAAQSAKLAKKKEYRMTVVANAKAAKKVLAAAETTEKTASTDGFKSPSEFTSAEKSTFVRKAQAAGFDLDYIESFLGEPVSVESAAVQEIKGVMASEIPKSVKIAAVRGLLREAKLDAENVSRCERYWKEELGYGDEAWVDDLFATDYDK